MPPNQHLGNRVAFATLASPDAGVTLYTHLIALELNLKDRNTRYFVNKHDVFSMIRVTSQ